jgi:hypothetical protein
MAPQPMLTAADVRKMLDRGAHHSEVVDQLVSTGIWSDAGAKEIVRFMTHGPDELLDRNRSLPTQKGTR